VPIRVSTDSTMQVYRWPGCHWQCSVTIGSTATRASSISTVTGSRPGAARPDAYWCYGLTSTRCRVTSPHAASSWYTCGQSAWPSPTRLQPPQAQPRVRACLEFTTGFECPAVTTDGVPDALAAVGPTMAVATVWACRWRVANATSTYALWKNA